MASKSTRKTFISLNFGSAVNLSRMGLCALQVGHQSAWISTRIGLPDACAALKASAENGTAVPAPAEASCTAVTNAAATIAPLKILRDNIIVNSVFDLRSQTPIHQAGPLSARTRVTVRGPRMLPHHARDKPRLAPRWLDVLFQKAVSIFSGISRPCIGPGPAFVVASASRLAGFVAVTPLEVEIAVIPAEPVNRGLDRSIARFDHAGAAHARDAAIILDARRHAVLQPADRTARDIARIVEAPGPATPVPFAHQRAIRRIAGGHRRAQIVAARTIEIGLGIGRPQARGGRKQSERHQTRPDQAASPHSR